MSLYTYTFLEEEFNRDDVTEFLEKQPEVSSWFYNLPHMVFIETNLSATELSKKLTARFGRHRHFIAKVPKERYGILPKDHWDLFPENKD